MGSKAFVLLGLLLATVLLISSEVTARDLVETSTPKETTDQTNNGVEDAKYYGGGGCRGYGCGGGGGGCRGYGCGGGGGGCRGYGCGGGGGGCRGYGCGGGGGGGGCSGYGCGGGGGGGYCHFGCCRYGYGGCRRCCSYEGEPVDKED